MAVFLDCILYLFVLQKPGQILVLGTRDAIFRTLVPNAEAGAAVEWLAGGAGTDLVPGWLKQQGSATCIPQYTEFSCG